MVLTELALSEMLAAVTLSEASAAVLPTAALNTAEPLEPEALSVRVRAVPSLLSVPLAAFYPYTPLHLQDLGIQKTSAFMALGQLLEAASMLAMAPLLRRFNLRSIFVFAIAVACLRYLIFFSNTLPGLVIGILLHGICFTLFFIPAQIYVEQHIPKDLRFRAQALMTLLISGFGNLLGFLGCGALYRFCTIAHKMQWSLYWLVLAVMVALVGGYFLRAYRSASERSDPFVLEKSSVI